MRFRQGYAPLFRCSNTTQFIALLHLESTRIAPRFIRDLKGESNCESELGTVSNSAVGTKIFLVFGSNAIVP
jgi:hypothetical protein